MRRQAASRIGEAGVAQEMERLTAAPAKIDVPPVAAPARLGHPSLPAKASEGFGLVPSELERMLAHIRKVESRERVGAMTGEREPVRSDHDEPPRPTIHARLRVAGVVVG